MFPIFIYPKWLGYRDWCRNPSWRKGKYKKTIIEAMAKWLREDDDSTQEESENLAYNILGYASKYLPDLYAIDEETRTIRLLEIEDTSKLTKEKITAYSNFWHDADYYEIALEIYTADRYGRNIQPLNLWPTFCNSLNEQSEKDFKPASGARGDPATAGFYREVVEVSPAARLVPAHVSRRSF